MLLAVVTISSPLYLLLSVCFVNVLGLTKYIDTYSDELFVFLAKVHRMDRDPVAKGSKINQAWL